MLNRFEQIKNMDIEKMTEFLDKYLSCHFCDKYINTEAESCMDFCDKRKLYIKKWLYKKEIIK